MRGQFSDQSGMFPSISPEDRVPKEHPLRVIRETVRSVLQGLYSDFCKLYSSEGRPSIPPEQLLSALLLQAFYGIRSERQLMKQLDYNLLYRWFVALRPDDPVWVATTPAFAGAGSSPRTASGSSAAISSGASMHLWMGQATRHNAKNQTSRHCSGDLRLPAQYHRLQPRPHPQTNPRIASDQTR